MEDSSKLTAQFFDNLFTIDIIAHTNDNRRFALPFVKHWDR